MTFKNKRILWKAIDGREFIVDTSNCETFEDVQKEIDNLRKVHNIDKPDAMSAFTEDEALRDAIVEKSIDLNDLSEAQKSAVIKAHNEALKKPDIKKLN